MKNKNIMAIVLIIIGVVLIGNEFFLVEMLKGLPGIILIVLGCLIIVKQPITGEMGDRETVLNFKIEKEEENVVFFNFKKELSSILKKRNTYFFSHVKIQVDEIFKSEINGIFSIVDVNIRKEDYDEIEIDTIFSILKLPGTNYIFMGKKKVDYLEETNDEIISVNGIFSFVRIKIIDDGEYYG